MSTESADKITVEFVPAPVVTPIPDKIVITAPNDRRGHPIFPTLHLTIDQAIDLHEALGDRLTGR